MRLNRKVIKAWVRALRSGRYKQGQSMLKNEHLPSGRMARKPRHCCLGVLCEIHKKQCDGSWNGGTYHPTGSKGSSDYLPRAVRLWAGLPENDPKVRADRYGGTIMNRLSHLNDSGQFGFKRIATAIEKTFLK